MDPMNLVCKPFLDKFMIVFIDDILIYSKNNKEYEEHLKAILELLKKEELYAKFSKCKFWLPNASPKMPTEIRQFLGLAGYYRRFIEGFSKIAKPMTKLTQKKTKIIIAYCVASSKVWAAVLMQREKCSLSRFEAQNFMGPKCMVFTDHKSLQHILNQKELNMRQRRWLDLLSDYNCEIRYHPRKAKVVADTEARKPENIKNEDVGGKLDPMEKLARMHLKEFLQNILDLYFKHFKLSEDVVNRILQVVLDLQHFKSSLFIFAATILQSSSAIHHISNIDNYVHQIIKFQSILITSSHSLWSSQSFGHQKGVCPWLTENHFNSQYLKHWASQSFGT
ncbi:putative reverse transcriptase domain-containing protein [Tanacetum coccineum]